MPYIVLVGDPFYFVSNYGLSASFSKAKRFSSYVEAKKTALAYSIVLKSTYQIKAVAK